MFTLNWSRILDWVERLVPQREFRKWMTARVNRWTYEKTWEWQKEAAKDGLSLTEASVAERFRLAVTLNNVTYFAHGVEFHVA